MFTPTQERILVTCHLVHMGPKDKHIRLKDATKVDLNLQATQCVKLVWYREEVPLNWEEVVASPLKHLTDLMEWAHS